MINHFDGDGESAPVEPTEVVSDPGAVKLCGTSFEAVWERAIPHEAYELT
ncbi:DUF6879 family protein [Streptomyces hainanensis]